MIAAIESAKTDFESAIYGEDVRDALVDVADVVEEAVEDQIRVVDAGLTQSGEAADAAVVGTNGLLYRGNVQTLEYTMLSQCLSGGWYQIPSNYVGSITDLPSDFPSGSAATLTVYAYSSRQWQELHTLGNWSWRRFINQGEVGVWYTCQVRDSGASALNFYTRGVSNLLGITSLSQCLDSGAYQIRRYDLENLDDLPPDYPADTSSLLRVYKYVDGSSNEFQWQILRSSYAEWTRFINQGTPQSWTTMIAPKKGYASGQIHFNVTINGTALNAASDAQSDVSVNAVLVLPESYTAHGTPTKLIFMHHGVSGTVSNTQWYGNSVNWTKFYTAYINAGYAVFDVNGVGAYASTNNNNKDYGAPACIQAAIKAYEYILASYNIDPHLYVHGSSMGGATAVAFAKKYPELVRAVGLFAPAELRAAAVGNTYKEIIATNYGYTDAAAMVADGYAELIPSAPTVEHYDGNGARLFLAFADKWTDVAGTHLCRFPMPVKIWHGTADTDTSPTYSSALIDAIRADGGTAYFRSVEGGTHSISTGADDTVIAEAVLWFNRF